MMNRISLPDKLSIAWLHEKYLSDELTPEQVIIELISRANEDAEMNIWISPPRLASIQPYLDQLAAIDKTSSVLWGIPFAIKDNIDLCGVPTTAGCPAYAYTPSEHAAVVERLLAAGAIPLGKTNMDQFATGLVGTRSPYGETHNALRPDLISGGSSSGSSVAVARGHAVFALGTDTAGSGRVPAALNDIIGFKPSLGAWPVKGVVPACASLDCVTVFAQSMEDVLCVDGVVRGIHQDDPWSRDLKHPLPKLPRKICLPREPLDFFGPYAAEYRLAWQSALEKVKRFNLPVEYVDLDLFSQAAALLYEGPWVAERWADLGRFVTENPHAMFPVTEQILRAGAGSEYDAASLFRAMHKLQAFKLAAKKLLQDAVLVLPTTGGTWTRDDVRLNPIATNRDLGRYTNHCNLLDLCAISVPCGKAMDAVPFGISLFALAEREDLISGVAGLLLKPAADTTLVAVCGLHMRGYPLEKQMNACGAHFIREASSAAKYKMVKLPTVPSKPGMIKQQTGGASILMEIWEMPLAAFGAFAASIPAPLGIGKVELLDGSEIPGFVCEAYAAFDAEDITAFGGWRNVK